jgi:hypothetical protein
MAVVVQQPGAQPSLVFAPRSLAIEASGVGKHDLPGLLLRPNLLGRKPDTRDDAPCPVGRPPGTSGPAKSGCLRMTQRCNQGSVANPRSKICSTRRPKVSRQREPQSGFDLALAIGLRSPRTPKAASPPDTARLPLAARPPGSLRPGTKMGRRGGR